MLLLLEHPDQKNAIELNMRAVAKIPSFLYISRLLSVVFKICSFCVFQQWIVEKQKRNISD